jgi:hypothetical protein
MLTFFSGNKSGSCDGATRRDFIRVGSLGLAGLSLPNLLAAKTNGADTPVSPIRNKSVIWVWLAGGPTAMLCLTMVNGI